MLTLQAASMAAAVTLIRWGGAAIDVIAAAADPSRSVPTLPAGLAMFGVSAAGSTAGAVRVGVAMAALATVRAGLDYAYAIVAGHLVHHRLVVDLRIRVYERLQQLGATFYRRHEAGSLINRVTGDVQATRQFIDGVLVQVAVLTLALLFYGVTMFRIHAPLAAACLVTTPVVWWMGWRFSRRVRPLFDEARRRLDDLVSRVAESSDGVTAIKALGSTADQQRRFDDASGRLLDHRRRVFREVSRFGPSVQFVTQISLGVLLGYGGYLVSVGELPLGGGLIVMAGCLQQFSGRVGNLSQLAGTLQQSLSGAARVFEVLDTADDLPTIAPVHRPERIRGGIEFRGVTVAAPGGGPPILDGIDLTVPAGQRVGVLAETGGGKSTLLSLVPRLMDPDDGEVRIDGVDVRRFDRPTLRRSIGYVMQEPILISHTIAANIALARPDADIDAIRDAARAAMADEFISGTDDGYETLLGQNGWNLSGGQRQRIALARAVLTDPPVMVLDDPIAAVDPGTEQSIIESLRRTTAGRTTLVAASRLATLRLADRVIVLRRGRIVQDGAPEELIRVPGIYRDTAAIQGWVAEGVPADE